MRFLDIFWGELFIQLSVHTMFLLKPNLNFKYIYIYRKIYACCIVLLQPLRSRRPATSVKLF